MMGERGFAGWERQRDPPTERQRHGRKGVWGSGKKAQVTGKARGLE